MIALTLGIVDRLAQGAGHGGGSHRRAAEQRVVVVGAAGHRADAVDDGDAGAAGVRAAGALQVLVGVEQLGAGAGPLLDGGVDLVAVAEVVDELLLGRLGAEERAAVDEGADGGGVELPALGDAADQLAVHRLQDGAEGLLVGGGVGALGVAVEGVLVLVAVVHADVDLEEVEGAAEEPGLGEQAGQADVAGGLQPDLVEGGGEVVALVAGVELAEGLGEGDREFAGGAEGGDGVAQLLGRGHAGAGAADAGDQADDAVVAGGALEGGDDVGQAGVAAAEQLADRVAAGAVGERSLEVELEDRPGGDGLAAAGAAGPGDQEHQDQQGGRDAADDRQEADEAAAGAGWGHGASSSSPARVTGGEAAPLSTGRETAALRGGFHRAPWPSPRGRRGCSRAWAC
jgi:hypothetical protein